MMTGKPQTCTFPGCTARPLARRLCRAHYLQEWRAGTLTQHEKLPPKQINRGVCPPDHKHAGTLTCYVHHQCRCEACRTARTKREYRRKQLQAYGRYDTGLVDAGPVREHMLMLAGFGIGYKRVARLAGLGVTPVRTVIWGRQDPGPRHGEMQKRIKRETAAAILAVRPDLDSLAGGAMVPARGVHRRVQALVARGWSQQKIADRLGIGRGNFGTMMNADHVRVSTYWALITLYEQLWDQQPPRTSHADKAAFSRALTYAAHRRWLPPMAWDDIDTDPEPPTLDEEAGSIIDDVAVQLACAGDRVRLTPAERRECVRRLHARNWSAARIAGTLHVTDKTIDRIRAELGLVCVDQNDLIDRGAA